MGDSYLEFTSGVIIISRRMNRWINRNAIFPRVKEKRTNMRWENRELNREIVEQIVDHHKSTQIQEVLPSELKRYSVVSDKKFDFAQLRISRSPRRETANSRDCQENCDPIEEQKKQANISLQLEERKKEEYRSKLAKEHMLRLKALQIDVQSSAAQTADAAKILAANQLPARRRSLIRYRSSKVKTQGVIEQLSPRQPRKHPMQDQLNRFLNVKQAKQFDYGSIIRQQLRKEVKLRLPALQRTKAKQTFKITSMRGWEIEKETCYMEM